MLGNPIFEFFIQIWASECPIWAFLKSGSKVSDQSDPKTFFIEYWKINFHPWSHFGHFGQIRRPLFPKPYFMILIPNYASLQMELKRKMRRTEYLYVFRACAYRVPFGTLIIPAQALNTLLYIFGYDVHLVHFFSTNFYYF